MDVYGFNDLSKSIKSAEVDLLHVNCQKVRGD